MAFKNKATSGITNLRQQNSENFKISPL